MATKPKHTEAARLQAELDRLSDYRERLLVTAEPQAWPGDGADWLQIAVAQAKLTVLAKIIPMVQSKVFQASERERWATMTPAADLQLYKRRKEIEEAVARSVRPNGMTLEIADGERIADLVIDEGMDIDAGVAYVFAGGDTEEETDER